MSYLSLVSNPRRRRRKAKKSHPRRAKRAANPRRRPRKHAIVKHRRRSNPVRRLKHRRKYHRNPASLSGITRGIPGQLKDATIGALGALATDIAAAKLNGYLPASLQGTAAQYAFRGALAIAMGVIASKIVKGSTAAKAAEGALVTIVHDAMKTGLAAAAPSLGLSAYLQGLGWQGSGPTLRAYLPTGQGDGLGGLGTAVYTQDNVYDSADPYNTLN